MRVGSLFSGIGGLDHGLANAGHRHVFFCESDPWRRDVLAARWPGVPIYDDVRLLRPEPDADAGRNDHGELGGARRGERPDEAERHEVARGRVDLLCGGFPCQDLSVAGRRAGLAGDRSGLFFEFARIIQAFRPGWVLVENVPGLLSSNGGRDFGVVLGTLADLGYGVAWRVLDSRFFGVPQRRRRVFIVGAVAVDDPRAAAERAGEVLAVGSRCERHPATRGEAREDVAVASLSGLGSGGPDDNDGQANRVIASALVKRYGKGTDSDATDALIASTLKSQRGKGGGGIGPEETLVARPLKTGGNDRHDESHDTYVAAPLTKGSATGEGVNQPGRRQEDDVNIVAFHPTGGGSKDLSPTENQTPGTGVGNGGSVAIAYALRKDPGGTGQGHNTNYVAESGVRRLTPRECERLQGLPDDWTLIDAKTPDSRRYSALGDAVTANVAEWIGRRLA